MRDFCAYTGIPITQKPVLYPARLSLVHPELDYTIQLDNKEALGYLKAITRFCEDATQPQDYLAVESGLRLLLYRFLHRNHKCADAFRPVLLTDICTEKPDLVLSCKSLALLMQLPATKVVDLPYVQHLDRDTPVRLYGVYDNGLDSALEEKLGELLVFIAEKDRIQASLETRVRTMVRVLTETGTPTELAVTLGRAWMCEMVVSRCSNSSAEYSDDNITMLREEARRLMSSNVAGSHVYTYTTQWVSMATTNAVFVESPATVSMMRYLERQWASCRKSLTEVIGKTPPPVVFAKTAPPNSGVKFKSKLKGAI